MEKLTFILEKLSLEEVSLLQEYLQQRTYQAGEIILKQGELGQRFFMLEKGEVEVILEGTPEVKVAVLKAGDFFGEISCLTGEPITATIKAVSTVETNMLTRPGLLKLLDIHPPFMRQILDQLLRRMSKSNERVQQESLKSSVLIQSVLSEGKLRYSEIVGTSSVMHELRREIKKEADRDEPIGIIGERGTGKEFVAGHLHYSSSRRNEPFLKKSGLNFNLEEWRMKQSAARGGTLLLLEADALPTETLKQILRESIPETRIILAAQSLPNSLAVKTITVPPLRERREDIPLLLNEFLRREGVADPNQTISGAAMRKLMLYPFLNGNVQELFEVVHKAIILSHGETIYPEHIHFGSYRSRNSRLKVGLALGAGAVRGSAHVGVLKVLEEEGIQIDLIAGCSVGALVGALYAAGKSVKEMEATLPKVTWKELASLSWPKIGLLSNSRMDKWLKEQIGELQVEDLKLPFAAVATDAYTGMPVIMQKGPVSTIVRASSAIPFIMKPVQFEDKLLWDGSIVHKVPIHLARSMGADVVIAVDVGLPAFKKGKIKNLFDAFMFPLDIMQESVAQDELELADVLLQPTADISGYSFKSAPVFFKKGEEVTREAISRIRDAIESIEQGFSHGRIV